MVGTLTLYCLTLERLNVRIRVTELLARVILA